MWITYSETGERGMPVHSSEAEKHGKWLPPLDAEVLFRCSEEPETELDDEWEAVLATLTHEQFVAFMTWIWQGGDYERED